MLNSSISLATNKSISIDFFFSVIFCVLFERTNEMAPSELVEILATVDRKREREKKNPQWYWLTTISLEHKIANSNAIPSSFVIFARCCLVCVSVGSNYSNNIFVVTSMTFATELPIKLARLMITSSFNQKFNRSQLIR